LARYGQEFKDKAVARLLPPESASIKDVALSVGVSESTLERWRSEALANPERRREWTPAARFEAVLATAAMDEASKSAWCRGNGVYPHELAQWREQAVNALAQPGEKRLTAAEAKQDRRRIKELEREIRRKDKALAEAAALLVLSKKAEAIFNKYKAEDE
jgi:transposase-like protein